MPSNGTPVKISTTIKINRDGKREKYELIVFGQWFRKDQTTYLIYDEYYEKKGKIHTVIKFTEGQIPQAQIIRKGSLNMMMYFKEKEIMGGTYKTEVGHFKIKTITKKLTFQQDDEAKTGTIKINYDFYMEELEVGSYQLQFNFKEDKGK